MKHYLTDLRSKLATAEKCPSMMRGGIGQIPHRKKDNKGFTLVELIVVIVILAILAAILVPGLLKWIDEARDKQYQLEARSIYMATQGEIAKSYGTGASLGTTEVTIDGTSTDITLAQISKLSGLTVTEVKYKGKEEGTGTDKYWVISEFQTTFDSSNGVTGVTMKWTATTDKWEKQ